MPSLVIFFHGFLLLILLYLFLFFRRSIYLIRDPSKDKPFELEIGWISDETDSKFCLVPPDLL